MANLSTIAFRNLAPICSSHLLFQQLHALLIMIWLHALDWYLRVGIYMAL